MINRNLLLILATLGLIVFLSFGQSVQFSIWQDDNALFFKLQHLDEQVGVFGPEAAGLGTYRYIALPYVPIYNFFGMNVRAFYLMGMLFYFLAAVSIFILTCKLANNKLVAFLSSAIFAAGFIGSEGILRLFNSVQTSYSILFASSFFLFLYFFVTTQKVWYYLISLFLFLVTLESAFLRTQYLIVPTMVFLLLFLNWKTLKNFWKNIFLALSFLIIYQWVFSHSVDARASLATDYLKEILSGKLDYLYSFFGSLGNIILPQPIMLFLFNLVKVVSLDYTNRLLILELIFLILSFVLVNIILKGRNKFYKIFFTILPIIWFVFGITFFQNSERIFVHAVDFDSIGMLSNFLGGLFLIVCGAIVLILRNSQKNLSKISLFLIFWMLSNILAYSTYLPFYPLESINRYLTHSLVAYAILVPLMLYFLWKKIAIMLSILIISINLFLSIDYQRNFITEKSIPTEKFYNQLKGYLPEIKKGSILYFDIADDEKSQQQFRDFFSVGSMPDSTAIAVRYRIDRYDFVMTNNSREFLKLIKDKPLNLVYSFFYNTQGLKNTTSDVRSNLTGNKKISLNNVIELGNYNLSSATPIALEFTARVLANIPINASCTSQISKNEKNLFFEYLLSRDDYKKRVEIKTISEDKYLTADFLTDGRQDTLWRGNRGWWYENGYEEVLIDLGVVKNVGQVVWINSYANSTPINYGIQSSINGKNWLSVKKVVEGIQKGNGELVEDNFFGTPARYIKFEIKKTFDNDSPVIGEIEVVEEKFSKIKKEKIEFLEKNAYCVTNQEEKENLEEFIAQRGIEGVVSWKTDKSIDNKVKVNLNVDGRYYTYKVTLQSGGTVFKDLKIESGLIPAEIFVTNLQLIYLDQGVND